MEFWKAVLFALKEPLGEAFEITVFVCAMMILLDYVSARTDWLRPDRFGRGPLAQVLAGSLLGAVPGCMGSYATVSMYSRGVVGFGALLASMVATMGDETFLMLARFPKIAIAIIASMALLGIAMGLCINAFGSRKGSGELKVEEDGHSHQGFRDSAIHVLRSHSLKLFAWTYGIMFCLALAGQFIDLEQWIQGNVTLMILVAALVGLIPESGPHMIFITMFAAGTLPFPVLLANCISQDGHAGLPLLATSKKAFFAAKAIKLVLALLVAYLWHFIF